MGIRARRRRRAPPHRRPRTGDPRMEARLHSGSRAPPDEDPGAGRRGAPVRRRRRIGESRVEARGENRRYSIRSPPVLGPRGVQIRWARWRRAESRQLGRPGGGADWLVEARIGWTWIWRWRVGCRIFGSPISPRAFCPDKHLGTVAAALSLSHPPTLDPARAYRRWPAGSAASALREEARCRSGGAAGRTKLAVFYARCGALADAESAFAALPEKNAFAWAAVIGLWSRAGLHARTLAGFANMLEAGVPADNFVVPSVLQACAGLGLARAGRAVHRYAWKAGVAECVYVMSSLVDFYGKCGEMGDARGVFDTMPERTVVTWNSMLMAYIRNGRIDDAVDLFYEMRVEGVLPTRVSLVSFLSASADLEAADGGRQGHAVAVSSGLEMDVILGTSMINFYCKAGLLEAAETVFEQMAERDIVTWNLMIAGYLEDGQIDMAFDTCRRMLMVANLKFDCVTLASVIIACVKSCCMVVGTAAHGYAVRNGLESDKTVACGLIELYATSGRIGHARRVVDAMSWKDTVMWKVMISAYADCGMSFEALKLLYQMKIEGISPTAACWDSTISAFLRNGQVDQALDIFSEMLLTKTRPNLRTWSLLISALSQHGMHQEVTNLCCKMQEVESAPSPTIYSAALLAVQTAALVHYGKALHACVVKKGLLLSKSMIQSLLNMYNSFNDRGTMDSLLRLLVECSK